LFDGETHRPRAELCRSDPIGMSLWVTPDGIPKNKYSVTTPFIQSLRCYRP
jgi:hypothetical protein